MHEIEGKMTRRPDSEYPLFDENVINADKKSARYTLVRNAWFSSNVKPEHPPKILSFNFWL